MAYICLIELLVNRTREKFQATLRKWAKISTVDFWLLLADSNIVSSSVVVVVAIGQFSDRFKDIQWTLNFINSYFLAVLPKSLTTTLDLEIPCGFKN